MVKPFLSAKWKNLFMVNYAVDPQLLAPFIPEHCELDIFEGQALVSLVAFQFLDTRVKGFRIPGHVNFPEINLRLYVKRRVSANSDELRRGVVFIREIVPRAAITLVANTLFNEHYITRKMAQRVTVRDDELRAEYSYQEKGRTQRLSCHAGIHPQAIQPGSMEDFITEHYYGYNGGRGRGTREYRVEHPSWRTFAVQAYAVDIDFAATYGGEWAFLQEQKPHSVLLAEGSWVKVYGAEKVTANG